MKMLLKVSDSIFNNIQHLQKINLIIVHSKKVFYIFKISPKIYK